MGRESKLAETLAAADAVLTRGDPLTHGAIARELGLAARTVMIRVGRYRFVGAWPHPSYRGCNGGPPGLVTATSRAAMAAVVAIRGRGDPLTVAALAAELGIGRRTAWERLVRLRKYQLMEYRELVVEPASKVKLPEVQALEPSRPDQPPSPLVDRAFLADLRDGHTARMGDGRDQVDDPGEHGVTAVPWSGLGTGSPPPRPPTPTPVLVRHWRRARWRTSSVNILKRLEARH